MKCGEKSIKNKDNDLHDFEKKLSKCQKDLKKQVENNEALKENMEEKIE